MEFLIQFVLNSVSLVILFLWLSKLNKQPFNLIHIDTWGSYKVPTNDGFNYFLTIVDDYSKGNLDLFVGHQKHCFIILKSILIIIETKFNKRVNIIRYDHAQESGSSFEYCSFLNSWGILHQTSSVDTPQQNDIVERKHRHFLEVSKALLLQSKLPQILEGLSHDNHFFDKQVSYENPTFQKSFWKAFWDYTRLFYP